MKRENIKRLRARAEELSRHPKLMSACHDACFDEQLHDKAIRDPMAFLHSQGITVPGGLTVEFFKRPPRYLPPPDWTPFIFELINCRTYWLRECDDSEPPKCKFGEVEICFGFRVYPNPVQPGPVG